MPHVDFKKSVTVIDGQEKIALLLQEKLMELSDDLVLPEDNLKNLDFCSWFSSQPELVDLKSKTRDALNWDDLWHAFSIFYNLTGKDASMIFIEKWRSEFQNSIQKSTFIEKSLEAMSVPPMIMMADPATNLIFNGVIKLKETPFKKMWVNFLVLDALESWDDEGELWSHYPVLAHGDLVLIRTRDYLEASWSNIQDLTVTE